MNIMQWNGFVFQIAIGVILLIIARIIDKGDPSALRGILPFAVDKKHIDRFYDFYFYKFLPILEVVLITGTVLIEMIQFLTWIPEFNSAAFCFCLFMTAICGISSFILLQQKYIVELINKLFESDESGLL